MKSRTKNSGLSTKLIVALDVDSFTKAKRLVDLLYPKVTVFKVGLQLFLATGREAIKYIKRKGASVFLDLKFYDIPNTVANASKEMVRLGVDMFTLHCQGGKAMLSAAKRAVEEESRRIKTRPPLVLGVAVLTSQVNQRNMERRVLRLAREAKSCRLDGIVCSAWEAKTVRKKLGKNFIIVTPGIRLEQQAKEDQRRTATPRAAQLAGSNYLVIGRPIIKARHPLKTVEAVLSEINR
jgi:orotidine-5'-phosphate decarboxylase